MNPVFYKGYKNEKKRVELHLSAESLGIPQESGTAHYIELFICLAVAQGEAKSFNIQKIL